MYLAICPLIMSKFCIVTTHFAANNFSVIIYAIIIHAPYTIRKKEKLNLWQILLSKTCKFYNANQYYNIAVPRNTPSQSFISSTLNLAIPWIAPPYCPSVPSS